MRGKSHISLGNYLVNRYLEDTPKICRQAFLLGCIEPDRNPATYLKGSFRCQWLRGHNYRNARRFMRQISRRIEKKSRLNLWDFYSLGKLVHYTADAFTYAHNDTFSTDLEAHRCYEDALQSHFLTFLQQDPNIDLRVANTIMEAISGYHREYQTHSPDIRTDAKFALNACCCIFAVLMSKSIF